MLFFLGQKPSPLHLQQAGHELDYLLIVKKYSTIFRIKVLSYICTCFGLDILQEYKTFKKHATHFGNRGIAMNPLVNGEFQYMGNEISLWDTPRYRNESCHLPLDPYISRTVQLQTL